MANKKTDSERMTKMVITPMTPKMHKEITAKAKKMGLPLTAYMRLKASED